MAENQRNAIWVEIYFCATSFRLSYNAQFPRRLSETGAAIQLFRSLRSLGGSDRGTGVTGVVGAVTTAKESHSTFGCWDLKIIKARNLTASAVLIADTELAEAHRINYMTSLRFFLPLPQTC